jgi:hypothetical protein
MLASVSAGQGRWWPGRTWTSGLILIRVLHQGLFLQDRNCDLRERYTAGDRYEPLGSDGLWTERGPPTAYSKARLIVESGAGCRSSVADQVAYRLETMDAERFG